MAGAYLTIGAKFRPFSYDELIKPVAASAALHQQVDEQYGELEAKANIWENLANKETDKKSYERYKKYADDLRAQANNLAQNGLTPQSIRELMTMKARYSSDIVPIEQAYTRRRQLADEQRKLYMTNPTLKFQRDMSTTSLDDFVDNPELDYGYSVNGALVAKQAGEAYSHLAKAITADPDNPQYKPILNNTYYQSMVRSGYTPEQILAFARNDEDAPEVLKRISQQIYDSTGVEDFIRETYPEASTDSNQALQAQGWRDYVNSYINQGAWNAAGTTTFSTIVNKEAEAQRAMDLAIAKGKMSKTGKKTGSSSSASYPRRDQTIMMKATGGKEGTVRKTMGNIDISKSDSDGLLNLITSQTGFFSRKGGISEIIGIDEKGNYDTKTRSYKQFVADIDNMTVTNLRVDYESGNLVADIVLLDKNHPKNSEKFQIVVNPEIIGSDKAYEAMKTGSGGLAALNEAKRTGKRAPYIRNGEKTGIEYEYKDGMFYEYRNGQLVDSAKEDDAIAFFKNMMYNAAMGVMEYVGSVNRNTSTGAKMADSYDVSNVEIEDEEE